MGISLVFSGAHASIKTEALDPYLWPVWNPLHDDGDSRRLEIACLNKLYQTTAATIRAWEALNELRHSGKVDPDEYKRRVVALAVAIGKVIEGGGV
jgi:hypothetical protein